MLTPVKIAWTDGHGTAHEVRAQVNPHELTFEKSAQFAEIQIPGLDSPVLQFVRGEAETLSVELFFDTTDQQGGDQPVAVTELTDRVYELVKIDPSRHAPPICTLSWGEGFPGAFVGAAPEGETDAGRGGGEDQPSQRRESFRCVVERVQQRFTLFTPTGVPLRAVLTLSLKEHKTVEQQVEELGLQSADHTRAYAVQAGDTLASISARLYGDPARWRAIADHNRLHDPTAIEPGTILELPPIR